MVCPLITMWEATNRCDSITDACLKDLVKLEKPFKYAGTYPVLDRFHIMVVTVTIMQRCGASLISTASCYWDRKSDGS